MAAPREVACLDYSDRKGWTKALMDNSGATVSVPGPKLILGLTSSYVPVFLVGSFQAVRAALEILRAELD